MSGVLQTRDVFGSRPGRTATIEPVAAAAFSADAAALAAVHGPDARRASVWRIAPQAPPERIPLSRG